jgi:predicted ATPase
MGRNGSGKSTIFEVLELLRDFAARGERCEERFMGKTRTRWQDVSQQHFELDVAGQHGTYTYKLVIEETGSPLHLRVHHESVTLDGAQLFLFEKGTINFFNDKSVPKVKFAFDPRRSGLAIVDSRPENKKLSWFKQWLDHVLYVQIDPKRMGSIAEKETPYPLFDLENFASWYRHLRLEEGAAMEALRKSLSDVIGGFESLDLKDAGLNRRALQVSGRLSGKSVNYSFDELSDGQRALVGLYTLLHCSPGHESLLCIDEPDNFVALAEIQPWLMLLHDAQDTGLQILLASHHPELLNQLARQDGVILARENARHTTAKLFSSDSGTTLTPSELVARGWELV